MATHIKQHGHQYYFRIAIPRAVRRLFPGKTGKPRDYVVEPLGTDFSRAKVEATRRAAEYAPLFERAAVMTPEAIQSELAAIKDRAKGRATVATLPLLESELQRLRGEREAQMRERYEAFMAEREEYPPDLLLTGPDAETQKMQRRVMRATVYPKVAKLAETIGIALTPALEDQLADMILKEVEGYDHSAAGNLIEHQGETINQAAEHWFAEMQRPDAGVRAQTLDGHRLRVRAFVDRCGDVPLASITRAMASDFLSAIAKGRKNRTTNNYATTMQCLFKSARNRGRFQGENPFEGQRRKAGGEKREAFTAAEIHKLFAALPVETKPRKHSPETALPWVVRIAAYTGMRLEEIAQLTVKDVQTRGANGGKLDVFDIHNGDKAHHLKNDSSARAIPIHSELVRAGLLKYAKALPQDGLLFPGLKRRESKGGKIGARLGELFRKRLIALDMKRDGLCFHSLRHTVATRLESASVSQTDAARVLGHAIEAMTYGTYSTGPGLKKLAAVVEEISYQE